MRKRRSYSSYYVQADFDPNCIEEIKQFMLTHDFDVRLVSEIDLSGTHVTSANICFLDADHHELHCVANLRGKFLSRELFEFFDAHQDEIENFTIGSLF